MLSRQEAEHISSVANDIFLHCSISDENAKSRIVAALISNQGMEAVSDIGPALEEMNKIMENMADKVSF